MENLEPLNLIFNFMDFEKLLIDHALQSRGHRRQMTRKKIFLPSDLVVSKREEALWIHELSTLILGEGNDSHYY